MKKLIVKKFSPIIFLKKYNCLKCHNLNKNNFAPSIYDISRNYKNNKKNKIYLFKKIKFGSKNIWGKNLIMPANNLKKLYIYIILKWLFKIKKLYN